MARSKHILPFLLEGAVQEIDFGSSSESWNRLTSFVNIQLAPGGAGASTFTVDAPLQKVPGALLSIHLLDDNGLSLTVQLGSLALDDEFEDLVLINGKHSVLLMWNGEKWVVLSQAIEDFTGGTLSSVTTFENRVIFEQRVRFESYVFEKQLVPVNTGDNDNVITTSNILRKIMTCDPSQARAKATDTAANIISAVFGSNSQDNDSFDFTFINESTTSGATVTLSGGTDVTFVGNTVVDPETSATFRCRRVSATTVTIYRL